jgi:hypothetical protein
MDMPVLDETAAAALHMPRLPAPIGGNMPQFVTGDNRIAA